MSDWATAGLILRTNTINAKRPILLLLNLISA
jgi:hypothetical protein